MTAWVGSDSPVQILLPAHSAFMVAIYLMFAAAAISVFVVVGATVLVRIRYGHWPWRTCPGCEGS